MEVRRVALHGAQGGAGAAHNRVRYRSISSGPCTGDQWPAMIVVMCKARAVQLVQRLRVLPRSA
jgi:hypothetical protein